MISAFDIFKIGIGPSSSHTVGPMNAGKSFIDRLESSGLLTATSHIVVDLYGSLSLTAKAMPRMSPLSWDWQETVRRMLSLMRSLHL